jgi:hypothetical protein
MGLILFEGMAAVQIKSTKAREQSTQKWDL